MIFKWLPKYDRHCRRHHLESPEICPAFIEKVLEFGRPSRVYPDKLFPERMVFEGYFPPLTGRPYRVIFEVSDQQEVIPVSCWRIKERAFTKEHKG